MKQNFIKQLLKMSKYTLYGMCIQCLLYSFMFAGSSNAQRSLSDVQVSLDMKKVTLASAFDRLSQETGFEFVYDQAKLNLRKKIDVNVSGSLEKALITVSKDANVQFKRINDNIFVSKRSSNDLAVSEQSMDEADVTISGKITDEKGQGLPGASVVITGTTNGTTTDLNGNYRLTVPEDALLVISFVGYKTLEIGVAGRSTIDIQMELDAEQLDEVVVIGYGEESRQMLTSSIASVGAKDMENLQVTDVGNALQGKAAGVTINSITGQPGETPRIRVRSGSSLSQGNDPLVIIDGVQRTLEDFNPEDIESIEILKDAAASAIYGARASNGVILITTKQGTSGKARFSVNYRKSYSTVVKSLDLLGAEDYLRIERVGLTRSFLDENSAFGAGANATGIGNQPDGRITTRVLGAGETPGPGEKTMIDPVTGQTLVFQDNDWQDIVYRTSQIDNLTLSVDGGSDKITYYLGASYLDQEGIARTTGYKRFSLQSNTNFKVNDKLKLGTNINFTRSTSNEPFSTNTIFGRAARLAPTARLLFDDGTLSPGIRSNLPNPQHYTDNYLNNESINKVTIGGTLEWQITNDLVAKVYGNYFIEQEFRDFFVKNNDWSSTRSAGQSLDEGRQSQVEAILRYDKSLGDHNFSALAGTSRLNNKGFDFNGAASGGSTDAIQTLNAAPNVSSLSTFKGEDLLISAFGRLTYDYSGKYLFAASVRRDGSSRFGANNRAGVFPSFSAGWRISEESFFDVSAISGLKLRASWGQTGNNDVPLSGTQGQVNPGLVYNGQAASSATVLANADLGWETTTQTDIGFDLDLFESKVQFSFDYYKKVTSDMLFPRPLPNTTGFGSLIENIGKAQFTGLEFAVSTSNFDTKDFSWSTNFNISFTGNKVLELPDSDLSKDRIGGVILDDGVTGFGGLAEGEEIGGQYGYQFVKVYATTAEAQEDGLFVEFANDRTNNNGIDYRNRVGGDVKWLDVNGDNIINNEDQVKLGKSTPDITGGIGNTFAFKGFELYLFMDFALGHSIYNNHFARMNSNSQGNINGTSMLLRAWNEEGDITDVPRFVFFDFGNARNHDLNAGNTSGGGIQGASSQYLENASYLSLRTVRLSYNLPSSILDKVGIASAKAYVAGQNLHYFTGYRGYSPEALETDAGRYPIFKSISLGLNIGF